MPSRHHCALSPAAILFLTLLALLMAACGPAAPGSAPPTTIATRAGTTTIDVAPDSQEVDAKGLPVGFTRDGYAFRGDPNAPVLLEEYSDYQCPFCGRFFQQTLPALEENQIANGEVVLVFYDFPLTRIHPEAPAAHEAAHCAGVEGAAAYWAMHDRLFEKINEWSGQQNTTEIFSTYAGELGLDVSRFTRCLQDGDFSAQVHAGMEAGLQRGVNSTPSFFINGQPLTGAQPLEVFNQAIATVQKGGELAGNQPEPTQEPGVAPTPVSISGDYAAAKGNPSAAVTIVEYTDYECPYCSRHAQSTFPQLMEQFVETGAVYYVVKDFPLDDLHAQAREAAVAARCAGEQDAYWEMHDVLFSKQPQWAASGDEAAQQTFIAFASELALDTEAFRGCLSSGRYDDDVQNNYTEGLSFGINGTPSFFINGYPVHGAQPFELFDYAIELARQGNLAEAYTQPPQQAPPEPSSQEPVVVPIGDAPSVGDVDAPVVIVEYTDFQCPFCARHYQQTFPRIMEDFVETGKVRYVFKDFPLTEIHPQAIVSAEAARCANEQESYLEMHNMLFDRQPEWEGDSNAADIFNGYAEVLDLDVEAFAECLQSKRHEAGIRAELEEGLQLGVQGTPSFFINGYFISGAQPYDVFEELITEQLTEVQ